MQFSRRTRLSVAQLVELLSQDTLNVLLEKHGFHPNYTGSTLEHLVASFTSGYRGDVPEFLGEVLRTSQHLRRQTVRRSSFDTLLNELGRSLQLDGYRLEQGADGYTVVPIEPTIAGAVVVEDDLTRLLRQSGLVKATEVASSLEKSGAAFRQQPPDFNACLTNARVALQELATEIANKRVGTGAPKFDATKWGQVLSFLRTSGLISQKEEEGLSGVFSFVSPGAHVHVGLNEEEMTRLGRSLVVSMCYFLLKRHLG